MFAVAGEADAARRRAAPVEEPVQQLNGPAVLGVVSLSDQRISLYDAHGGAVRARISSGSTDYETPVGTFSILQKKVEHTSNLYDDASMPHMQRLTWSGIALHEGVLPGYPASHGCVRLPGAFAAKIFPLTRMGMRVVISRDPVAPISIAHPFLLKPTPVSTVSGDEAPSAAPVVADAAHHSYEGDAIPLRPDVSRWPARQRELAALKVVAAEKQAVADAAIEHAATFQAPLKKATAAHAKSAKALRSAEAAHKRAVKWLEGVEAKLASAKKPSQIKRAEAEKPKAVEAVEAAKSKLEAATIAAQPTGDELAKITEASNAADAAKTAAVETAKDAERKTLPISLFVSLKTKRLYVRQGNEAVFDTPITIEDPEQPIGTHVYTAVDYTSDGNDLKWNVVTIAGRSGSAEFAVADDFRRRSDAGGNLPPPTDQVAATRALDRLSLPVEGREKLSKVVWPGSSLIISDEAMYKETGKSTDFIVVMSGEPQGALKKRKPMPPPSSYWDDDDDEGYSPFFRYDERPAKRRRGGGVFNWW